MAAGLYHPTGSFLHRADPAAKILSLAACFGVALALARPVTLGALALLVLAAAAATGLAGVLARFSRLMGLIFAMSVILWALFSGDAAGLTKGIWLGLRLTAMLAMGLIFLASTRVEEMAAGLQRLGVPFMAAFSLTLSFRLLPLFAASAATIVQAQACRGLDLREGGLFTRLRRYLPLMVPLVLSSLRAADGLAVALESRGLGMGSRRSSALQSRFGPAEAALVALSSLAAAAAIALRAAGFAI